jgi:hypothetical protein
MTTAVTTRSRFFLAAAAFGLASLGIVSAASAHPVTTTGVSVDAGIQVKVRDHRDARPNHTVVVRPDDRPDNRRFASPYWIAMRTYDRNRNRLIDAGEHRNFWVYMAGSGTYGSLTQEEVQRFGNLAHIFDTNRDGRLLGIEWRGMDKVNDSLSLFARLDRNNDMVLTPHEVGFSALAPRFRAIDKNRDRLVTRQEVRDEVIKSFRAGDC